MYVEKLYNSTIREVLNKQPILCDTLIDLILQSFHMPLWNNKIKPIKMVEADRQFQATVCGWLYLMKKKMMPVDTENINSNTMANILDSEEKFVEFVIFEFMTRMIITDINPIVISRFKNGDSESIGELKKAIVRNITKFHEGHEGKFWKEYRVWVEEKFLTETEEIESLCYDAGNAYASEYEYGIISKLGIYDYEKNDIEKRFKAKKDRFFSCMKESDKALEIGNAIRFIMDFSGTFRSQQRWALVPRTPETTVQGHMFMVGVIAYLVSLDLGLGKSRATQNFLSAMMHDFGEGFVKDIISPIKSISNIEQIAKSLENENIYKYVIKPLKNDGETFIARRLMFLLSLATTSNDYTTLSLDNELHHVSEFQSTTVCLNCNTFKIQEKAVVDKQSIKCEECRTDLFCRDGEIVNYADKLSAYIEVKASILNGVGKRSLDEPVQKLRMSTNKMLKNIIQTIN